MKSRWLERRAKIDAILLEDDFIEALQAIHRTEDTEVLLDLALVAHAETDLNEGESHLKLLPTV